MQLYAVLLICVSSLFYVYEFFLRVMPSVITAELMQEFQITAGSMSIMTSCFLYAYAAMQIPAGLVVDRYGPRRVLTGAVLLCAFSTLLFQSTTSLPVAIISRLILGAASSVAFIAPLTLASRWFAPQYLALIAGCVQLLGCFGAILGGAPIIALHSIMTWREILLWAAGCGFLLAFVFCFFIADSPERSIQETPPSRPSILEDLTAILQNSQTLWISLAAFASWAAMGSLAELWGVPFLVTFHTLPPHSAALMVTVIWIGVAVGSPCAGWWTEYSKQHIVPLGSLLLLSLLTTTLLIYYPSAHASFIYLNLFLMGCAAGAQPITFSLVALHNPPERIATAFGLNNMAVVCGASLLQPSIGLLLDAVWTGPAASLRHYSILHYHYALAIVPLSILLGLLACYFIQDKKTYAQ